MKENKQSIKARTKRSFSYKPIPRIDSPLSKLIISTNERSRSHRRVRLSNRAVCSPRPAFVARGQSAPLTKYRGGAFVPRWHSSAQLAMRIIFRANYNSRRSRLPPALCPKDYGRCITTLRLDNPLFTPVGEQNKCSMYFNHEKRAGAVLCGPGDTGITTKSRDRNRNQEQHRDQDRKIECRPLTKKYFINEGVKWPARRKRPPAEAKYPDKAFWFVCDSVSKQRQAFVSLDSCDDIGSS
ncbi:hypothetical protein EVAR_46729_1 [Eumeta japonica]|uniref:Uncharacterized protein n=1 Tax=Eumeta variegata TaxID=151549 RepID=A0A4C1XBQ0_EUMVA|nr:hypothetical protein EVAR_46729_1 [Eumeta japonica]